MSSLGKHWKLSEERKKQIGLTNKGNKYWLGKKHSEKSKRKMSEIAKIMGNGKCLGGRKRPPFSEEWIRKLSKSHRGQISWNKGKNLSEETKRKIGVGNKGKKISEETRKKIGLANAGEKCHFWQGGKMKNYSETEKIRKSIEYQLWRRMVFERDNYTCQKTDVKGVRLHPHHINNFADYPELRLVIENGITLSEKSHREFHQIYGMKNNTREQLNEFLCKE